MADQDESARMPVVIERGVLREREVMSVPLHWNLGVFADHWSFPRAVGRVLADGSIKYDRSLVEGGGQ